MRKILSDYYGHRDDSGEAHCVKVTMTMGELRDWVASWPCSHLRHRVGKRGGLSIVFDRLGGDIKLAPEWFGGGDEAQAIVAEMRRYAGYDIVAVPA